MDNPNGPRRSRRKGGRAARYSRARCPERRGTLTELHMDDSHDFHELGRPVKTGFPRRLEQFIFHRRVTAPYLCLPHTGAEMRNGDE